MIGRMGKALLRDVRHIQIVALSVFLVIQFGWIDFGATPAGVACALGACLLTQTLACRITGAPFDWRSPAITALSIALLLRASTPLWLAAAGMVGIGSKFMLRIDGRHVFNPSGFAIVVMLLSGAGVWISPGQWGTLVWFAALAGLLATLILPSARRADITLAFLASFGALLLWRARLLGDPFAIPLHQASSGALLVFAFFMISDPPTTPNSRLGRVVFAFSVAAVAHGLAFSEQVRPALYFALIALAPLTPLFNRLLPAPAFQWRPVALEGTGV